MNPDTGQFEPATLETPSWWVKFKEGELVDLKNIRFRVAAVMEDELHLDLVEDRRGPVNVLRFLLEEEVKLKGYHFKVKSLSGPGAKLKFLVLEPHPDREVRCEDELHAMVRKFEDLPGGFVVSAEEGEEIARLCAEGAERLRRAAEEPLGQWWKDFADLPDGEVEIRGYKFKSLGATTSDLLLEYVPTPGGKPQQFPTPGEIVHVRDHLFLVDSSVNEAFKRRLVLRPPTEEELEVEAARFRIHGSDTSIVERLRNTNPLPHEIEAAEELRRCGAADLETAGNVIEALQGEKAELEAEVLVVRVQRDLVADVAGKLLARLAELRGETQQDRRDPAERHLSQVLEYLPHVRPFQQVGEAFSLVTPAGDPSSLVAIAERLIDRARAAAPGMPDRILTDVDLVALKKAAQIAKGGGS
jgi:hypothetical protein